MYMARFEPTPLQGDRGLIHEPDKQLRPLGHAFDPPPSLFNFTL